MNIRNNDIDLFIKKSIGIDNNLSIDIYKNPIERFEYSNKIVDIVNKNIPQIQSYHNHNLETTLKENGCVVLENYFSDEEVDSILEIIKNQPGYNYHIAATAYNQEPKVFSEDLDWNILSYKPDIFLQSKLILDKITNLSLLSLIQSYLGCFPTFYSVNCIWSKFTNENYKTQIIHRDYDDFKFLSFFVMLTDIDENNGPHTYYQKTQDGNDDTSFPLLIKGKKGTCFLADTYGLHHGNPLIEKSRCLLWLRFGLYVNNMHIKNKDYLFKQDRDLIFKHIEKKLHNEYLLRAFIK